MGVVSEQAIISSAFGIMLGAFAAYVGVLLLRLRPAHGPRTILAAVFLFTALASLVHLHNLAPGPLDTVWLGCLIVGAAAWTPSVLFLARHPEPIPWRRPGRVLVAATLAYAVLGMVLDVANNVTPGSLDELDAWIGSGAYSWQKGIILTALLFAGYAAIQHSNALVGWPLDDAHARYRLLATSQPSAATRDILVNVVQNAGALFAVGLFVWNKGRLAWALAAVGALTYSLRPRHVNVSLTMGDEPARAPSAAVGEGHTIASRYRVMHRLGRGGQGDAWLADDNAIGRKVVLKSVPPGGVREARLVGSLNHPRVIQLHDVIEATGSTLLVLEYVEGGDLRVHLTRRGALPPREADAILDGVLDAPVAVHARGIVHGDLKPENVLLDASGRPKLADFGIAGRHEGPARTVVSGAGTLAYMIPEQARGKAPTAASDLSAAALLYHEMLAGRPAFPTIGLDELQLRALIATQDARIHVEGARGEFLARALAREPARRFASASEMRAALQQAVR